MRFYHINAFADTPDGGNPAGVAICEGGKFPEDEEMQRIAADVGFSETAFIVNKRGKINIRYFTPECEVDLCGHATIAAFRGLMEAGFVEPGEDYMVTTKAGEIGVKLEHRFIAMTMAPARVVSTVKEEQSLKLVYKSLGLEYDPVRFMPACGTYSNLNPMVVDVGLSFLVVPINGAEALNNIEANLPLIEEISKGLGCAGIYAFAFETKDIGTMAHTRGFYPLIGIPEECATGTAVSALSFYLNGFGLFPEGREAKFIQGEAMGKPSELTTFIKGKGMNMEIMVGGNAAVVETRDIVILGETRRSVE